MDAGMNALGDAIMLEGMFRSWCPLFEPLDNHHANWARQLFVDRLRDMVL